MKCEVCGELLKNRIITINGVKMCDKCARAQTNRDLSALFGANPFMDEEIASLFPTMGIDFANRIVTCPKCHSTIRDIETTGRVGCIECFNTFNESVIKHLLRTQGTSSYEGRKPGQQLEFTDDSLGVVNRKESAPVKDAAVPKAGKKAKAPESVSENKEANSIVAPADDIYEKIKTSEDITSISDTDLNRAMKKAASDEDYPTAIKIRDELKRRLAASENNTDDNSGKEDN